MCDVLMIILSIRNPSWHCVEAVHQFREGLHVARPGFRTHAFNPGSSPAYADCISELGPS